MNLSKESVVLITGASSGIGRALALELASRGARLSLIARRAEMLDTVVRECRERGTEAVTIPCDVTIRGNFAAAVAKTIARFGHLDVLVNNAGRGHFAYVEDTPDEQIENIFRLNVFSLWYGTAAVLPHMRERKSGMIVNVGSLASKIGQPSNAAYVAAKHAVVGFTRALRSELVGSGVEAIVVLPAGVATDWAYATEGGSMLPIFQYERERGNEIAEEMGVHDRISVPLQSPEGVAVRIIDAIEHPRPQVYMHERAEELALLAETNPDDYERMMSPSWIANREGYLHLRGTSDE